MTASNVVQIKPSLNVSESLRAIADDLERREATQQSVTVIVPPDVYQLGGFDDQDAALEAVFNCNFSIHKLMAATAKTIE